MKATLFVSNRSMEIRLSNGSAYFSKPGESKEDFTNRINSSVETDFVEAMELEEFDNKNFKRYGTKQLQSLREKKTGVELDICNDILISRGALQEHPSAGGQLYNSSDSENLKEGLVDKKGKTKKEKAPKPQPQTGEEAMEDLKEQLVEASKKDKASKKEKDPKSETPELEAPKELKPLKKQMTEEEAAVDLEKMRTKKGKMMHFINKKGEEVSGKISGVRFDKRSGMLFYMVKTETGTFGKTLWSNDYTIDK